MELIAQLLPARDLHVGRLITAPIDVLFGGDPICSRTCSGSPPTTLSYPGEELEPVSLRGVAVDVATVLDA